MSSEFIARTLPKHGKGHSAGPTAGAMDNRSEGTSKTASKVWRDTFNAMSEAICILDTDFRFLQCNRAMIDLLNRSEAEIIGKTCWEVVHGSNRPIENCPCQRVKKYRRRQTLQLELKDRYFEVAVDPRFDEKGHIAGYIHIMSDITDIKAFEQERFHTEAQLRQAQKMEAIGTLAGGIAHDFNNILSAILGYSELALDDALHGRPSAQYIREILKAGGRARDLVYQILTFSRQTETEAKPILVQPIVKEALKLLRASLPSTITISGNTECNAIVEADPIQIHQVVMNLCTNAGHAMRPTGGTLEVNLGREALTGENPEQQAAALPGEYLKITVKDTGPGIERDILDRIFDPYFTTKKKGEGTGMGLAVVQGIVQGCHGFVTVETYPGKGACFNVYLPAIQMDEPVQSKVDMVIPGGHEQILFVDDEPPLADLSKQILERMGYRVTIKTSSLEALELFKGNPEAFDLVISDMTMPHMTGDVLTRKLQEVRPGIPVIICTGYSEKVTQEMIDRLKIRALIMKPIVRDELLLTVRHILDEGY